MSERTALIKLHDWDELIFGGFYCMHCTPDDEYSLDDPIAWPCPPLREAGVTDEEARALIVAHREKAEAEYRAKKEAEQAELQRRVDEFNSRYPVGTPVLAYPGARPEDGATDDALITRTRTRAQRSASGTDVVWVEGHGAYIALTHVDPVSEEQWEQARIDRDATTAARRAALLDAIRAYPSGGWKPDRAAFAAKRAGFGWVSTRTATADLDALAADGHLTPVTEVVISRYDLTEATS